MTFERLTLAREAVFEGLGLHGGNPVRVRVIPAGQGIRFVAGGAVTLAAPENVTDTTRCTKLGEVSTIEHLMSALAGLEITDADVEVVGGELPALDGSALPFYQGLLEAGRESAGVGEVAGPFARIFVQEPGYGIAVAAGTGHWLYRFDAGARWPGTQEAEAADVVADFPDRIAPARTFGFASEVEAIRAAGLARGLDLESALILGESGYENPARFPDEPARHKLLDAIGDLYLAGIPIRFLNVTASRTGHSANVEAARLLRTGAGPR